MKNMKKLISMLLCMMLMMASVATAEANDGEIVFPAPLPVQDYLAAFDAFMLEMGMPEGYVGWEPLPDDPDTLLLFMYATGEDLNTLLYTRDGMVEAIDVYYRDFPARTTTEMLQSLSIMAFGPVAMLGGAASVRDAYHMCTMDVFDMMPEAWYADEAYLVSGDFCGAYLAIIVQPMGDGSYMHNMKMVFSDDFFQDALDAGKTGSSSHNPAVFPCPVKMEDYLKAAEKVFSMLTLVGNDLRWVQDESGIWVLLAYEEPIGVLIREVNGELYVLGASCSDEPTWADQTFEMQAMLAVTPLAVLSGMTAEEAIDWWLSGVPYNALIQEAASNGWYYGVPTHLMVGTDEAGNKAYELLLLFYEGAETTLPGDPNTAAP